MKTLFRILGAAAAVAVTGVAIAALDKLLNEKDPLHVEAVEFPEEAEADPEQAEETAQAYAQAQPDAAEPQQPAEAEEEPEATPAAEVEAEPAAPAEELPNVNPVEAAPAVAPKDETGKFDPTKIAEASDFGDWEEQGCKG